MLTLKIELAIPSPCYCFDAAENHFETKNSHVF